MTGRLVVLATVAALCCASHAQTEPRLLSESELDQITAGAGGERAEQIAAIDAFKMTQRGTAIDATGSFEVLNPQTLNMLMLSDQAQQNLSALININSAGAPVNVLLNLNVNVNSEVGSLQQFNINGSPGQLSVTPGAGP